MTKFTKITIFIIIALAIMFGASFVILRINKNIQNKNISTESTNVINEALIENSVFNNFTKSNIENTIYSFDNGINYIDLNDDGTDDAVIKLYRNNGVSPHTFSNYSFSVVDENKNWSLVGIYKKILEDEQKDVETENGADGFLRDIRIIKYKNSTTLLVIGEREFGESYVNSRLVTFSFYKLKKNDGYNVPFGMPDYYFLYSGMVKSKEKYVDVQEAFEKELPEILKNGLIK